MRFAHCSFPVEMRFDYASAVIALFDIVDSHVRGMGLPLAARLPPTKSARGKDLALDDYEVFLERSEERR